MEDSPFTSNKEDAEDDGPGEKPVAPPSFSESILRILGKSEKDEEDDEDDVESDTADKPEKKKTGILTSLADMISSKEVTKEPLGHDEETDEETLQDEGPGPLEAATPNPQDAVEPADTGQAAEEATTEAPLEAPLETPLPQIEEVKDTTEDGQASDYEWQPESVVRPAEEAVDEAAPTETKNEAPLVASTEATPEAISTVLPEPETSVAPDAEQGAAEQAAELAARTIETRSKVTEVVPAVTPTPEVPAAPRWFYGGGSDSVFRYETEKADRHLKAAQSRQRRRQHHTDQHVKKLEKAGEKTTKKLETLEYRKPVVNPTTEMAPASIQSEIPTVANQAEQPKKVEFAAFAQSQPEAPAIRREKSVAEAVAAATTADRLMRQPEKPQVINTLESTNSEQATPETKPEAYIRDMYGEAIAKKQLSTEALYQDKAAELLINRQTELEKVQVKEVDFERRHEVKDNESSMVQLPAGNPEQILRQRYGQPPSQAPAPVPMATSTAPGQYPTQSPAQKPQTPKDKGLYKQAVVSGAVTAIVIIAILLAMLLLNR